ncbi:MAG TPA: histone deacetylase family protein, partial [Burkholderiaceae bacterium]
MKFTFSPSHRLHAPDEIIVRGTVVRNLETPARAEALLARLLAQGHEQKASGAWDRRWIAAVHDAGYLDFLETAYPRWRALPNASQLIHPHAFAHYSARTRPSSIQGQVGYYLAGGSS